jgi:FMN reductase [NAD(P)H]
MPSHHGVEVTLEREYPNETMRLLNERGSCRSFSKRKVTKEVMDAILEAGTHAATAGNLQTYSVVKIEDPGNRRWLRELGMQGFVEEAPVNLVFCIDYHRLKRWAELEVAPFTANDSFRQFWVGFQDAVIFAQTVCTAADAMGLGSVYVGTTLEVFRELKERLRLPDHVFPVVLVSMGYPEEKPASRKKLGVDIVVHNEVYQDHDDEVLLKAFEEKYTGPDSRRVEITEERIKRIRKVCVDVHGEEFADRCVAKIRENGYISAVQRYFGLHYVANLMPTGNLEFLKTMEDFGFGWFKKYVPPKDRI